MNTAFSFRHRLWIPIAAILLLLPGACSTVSTPALKKSEPAETFNDVAVEEWVARPPLVPEPKKAPDSPIPSEAVEMPKAGDTIPLGITITPELELAFNSYLGGDGEKALQGLARLEKRASDPAVLWQTSFLKAQILLMMGRAAAAEEELETTARLEIAHFGSDWNALALQGEVKVWLEDYDNALKDFARIISATGTWELPTQFRSFPTNRVALYYLTTAKLRAYTGIAGVHIFKEDYLKALAWSREAERLYNNAHFVVNHPLYGMGDEIHADAYYGRAMNLTFLASATLAVTGDMDASEALFKKAEGFYTALGYTVGRITVAALKARVFNRLGRHDLCYAAGLHAIKLAVDHGFPDYVWRIGVLSGATLYAKGYVEEAEKMLRQAQDAVDAISGNLATDRAKTRFGVGKSDIIHLLARIDIEKENWELLFSDLERARARSFVDLLADQALSGGRERGLVAEIRDLESEIIRQRLINMAPGPKNPEGIQRQQQLQQRRNEKLQLLETRDPEIADLIAVRYTGLKQVQEQLQQGEVIAYAVPGKAADPVRFFMITRDKTWIDTLDVTYRNVGRLVENFAFAFELSEEFRGVRLKSLKAFDDETVTPERAVADIRDAIKLDRWPVKRTLYVVPSADLYFLPWGVLETPYPIVSLPTGSWVMREPRRFDSDHPIVVVGDPDFGGDLPQLPGARREASVVGEIYGEPPLIGDKASKDAVRAQVGAGVRIIHLATHGIFRQANPLESAVFLSDNGKASALTAADIYNQPLPARMVVLSACETGLGRTIAGDDLLGLTRSFYLGGAVATLSSLWQIEDEGTMAFMRKFHELASDGDYGRAWVGARDHTKELGYAPSVYAAFVLGGAVKQE